VLTLSNVIVLAIGECSISAFKIEIAATISSLKYKRLFIILQLTGEK
jgi:hypothetical protein